MIKLPILNSINNIKFIEYFKSLKKLEASMRTTDRVENLKPNFLKSPLSALREEGVGSPN